MWKLLICLFCVTPAFAQPGGAAGANAPPTTPPYGSVFTAPVVANPCRSAFDRFYSTEPGVYAYWPLCEAGDSPGQDYAQDAAGAWDLVQGPSGGYPYGYGGTPTRVAGPVADGENALSYPNTGQFLKNDGFVVNRLHGTVASWVNGEAQGYPFAYVLLSGQPYTEHSYIKLARCMSGNAPCAATDGTECFYGEWHDNTGAAYYGNTVQHCGYTQDTWHRLVLTWSGTLAGGSLTLGVDGAVVATAPYTGQLDDSPFYYQLFSGNVGTTTTTSMAKALVSRIAWSPAQIAADFAANLAPQAPPAGGVVVLPLCSTPGCSPVVHKDVAGVADLGTDLRTSGQASIVKAAYQAIGIKSVRHAPGGSGIPADGEDWTGTSPVQCVRTDAPNSGAPIPANYVAGQNGQGDTLDAFMTQIAVPLGLDVMETVNYGSNPPACNAGGDPVVNGANLATRIAAQNYPVKVFQIGNEPWALSSNTDLHPNPYYTDLSKPSTYSQAVAGTSAPAGGYEAPFYTAIKGVMPSAVVDVGFPTGFGKSSTLGNTYLWPLMAAGNFDAVDIHLYPCQSSGGPDPNHPGYSDANIVYPELRSAGSGFRGLLLSTSALLDGYGKYPFAIHVGEYDCAAGGGAWSPVSHGLASALFSATALAEYAHDGVAYATWWGQGSGNGCSPNNVDPNAPVVWRWDGGNCGTHALFYSGSDGTQGNTSIGLKPGDPYPAGRGFQVMTQSGYLTEGEFSLQSFTDTSAMWLNAFAVTHGSGYAVLLVNRDPYAAHTIPVKLPMSSWTSGTQTTYGAQQFAATAFGNWSIGPATNTYGPGSGSFSAVVPAMSAAVVVIQ